MGGGMGAFGAAGSTSMGFGGFGNPLLQQQQQMMMLQQQQQQQGQEQRRRRQRQQRQMLMLRGTLSTEKQEQASEVLVPRRLPWRVLLHPMQVSCRRRWESSGGCRTHGPARWEWRPGRW